MLFDLQGKRKRVIQVIYAALAVLMGGGLVLFGIGGEVSGGLFDGLGVGNGRGADAGIEKRIERAEKKLATNPRDRAALLELGRGHYLQATSGEGYDQERGTFDESGIQRLQKAIDAWERYLETKPKKPSVRVARVIVQAYAATNDFEGATKTQRVIASATPNTGTLSQLALYSYLAGDFKLGDSAAKRAERHAEPDQRKTVRERMKTFRKEARDYRKQVEEAEKAQGEAGKEVLEPPFKPQQPELPPELQQPGGP